MRTRSCAHTSDVNGTACAEVNQGICLCSKESLPTPDDFIRCWVHECQRVFQAPRAEGRLITIIILIIIAVIVMKILMALLLLLIMHKSNSNSSNNNNNNNKNDR